MDNTTLTQLMDNLIQEYRLTDDETNMFRRLVEIYHKLSPEADTAFEQLEELLGIADEHYPFAHVALGRYIQGVAHAHFEEAR